MEAGQALSSRLGRITISSEAIAQIVAETAFECYGVVGMKGSLRGRLARARGRPSGIEIGREDGREVTIDLHVVVEYGLNLAEDRMPMFMCLLNWTEQGIRSVKEAPKRAKAAQELAKKVGVDIEEVYLTSGDSDLLVILDTPNGDNVAKFALAISSQGNVRTRTARIWPQSDFQKLISELP